MRKLFKFFTFCLAIYILFWFGTVLADRELLSGDLIRLHVVAASDSQEDQALKLQVRDAIVEELSGVMEKLPTVDEAKAYIMEHIDRLQEIANKVLADAGCGDEAAVSLTQESFDTREYDTFSLPAGVYESLRVTIGDGEGKNWWCVVFPTLCLGATNEEFAVTAAGSGFEDSLTGALQQEKVYEVRFFVLDFLGRIQNFFHRNG